MTPGQRRSIALDYWFYIAAAIGFIVLGTWAADWQTPSFGTYFIALAFIIHAHGNRIRATLIALNTTETK